MPLEGIANLPAGAHLFLDANIFIYAFLGHSIQCRNLLGRCASEQVFGITSFEVVNEVTHRLMVAEAPALSRGIASEIYEANGAKSPN